MASIGNAVDPFEHPIYSVKLKIPVSVVRYRPWPPLPSTSIPFGNAGSVRSAEQSSIIFVHFHLIREFAHVGKQRRFAFGQSVKLDIGRGMKVRCVFGAIIVADLPAIEVAQLSV